MRQLVSPGRPSANTIPRPSPAKSGSCERKAAIQFWCSAPRPLSIAATWFRPAWWRRAVTVVRLGMPVDPGNLLMLGRLGPADVIGVPSCAASPKVNGFDWVLQRRLAGLAVGARDISMAPGRRQRQLFGDSWFLSLLLVQLHIVEHSAGNYG